MTKEEESALKDVIGMLNQLVGKEELQQAAPTEDSKFNQALEDQINFVKELISEELDHILFMAVQKDGFISEGRFTRDLWNKLLNAFVEKYG